MSEVSRRHHPMLHSFAEYGGLRLQVLQLSEVLQRVVQSQATLTQQITGPAPLFFLNVLLHLGASVQGLGFRV